MPDFSGFSEFELRRLLAEYEQSSVGHLFTRRTESIREELATRVAPVTLAIDEEFRLVAKVPGHDLPAGSVVEEEYSLEWRRE
jgi:hypothetical protein